MDLVSDGLRYSIDILKNDIADLDIPFSEEYKKIRAMDRCDDKAGQEETTNSRREQRTRRARDHRLNPETEMIQPCSVFSRDGERLVTINASVSSRLERSFFSPRLLQRLGLDTRSTAQVFHPLGPTCLERSRRQQKREKRASKKLREGILTGLRVNFVHSPLPLAAIGTHFMGRRRSGAGGHELGLHVTEGDGVGHSFYDMFPIPTISPALLLLAPIAIASFSLTGYHFILVQQGKDHDLVVLSLVGAGIIAGLVAGLDGITIILRIAPWCAIVAFFLCAFVLPPRGRNVNDDGIQETEEAREQTWFDEKEAVMKVETIRDSKSLDGWEPKKQTSDVQMLV